MHNTLRKLISLILIFLLFWGRVFYIFPAIAGEDVAPTQAPAPTSAPLPTKPPSEARPTSAPKPTSESLSQVSPKPTEAPKPTSAPLPTSAPSSKETSEPASVLPTESRAKPLPSSTATPTGGNSLNNQPQDQVNSGEGSLSFESGSIDDPLNQFTSAYSENFAEEVTKYAQEIVNKNLAELQNKLEALSITGFNSADYNTLSGNIYSGDTFVTLNLLNKLNSNISGLGGFQVFNIYDAYLGDIVFQMTDGNVTGSFSDANATVSKNSVTGPQSTNTAEAEKSFIIKEATGNEATLENDIVLQAVSGGNSTSGNTGGGEINTGNAAALGNVMNMVNTNLNVTKWLIGVVNIFGKLGGNIILPKDSSTQEAASGNNQLTNIGNSSTGAFSDNQASYESETMASFTNDNFAAIQTDIQVSANTGNNDASLNTLGGSVTSGNADVELSNSTVANQNIVEEEGTVWMVIVNQMGKWLGQIIGQPQGTNYASNSLPIENETSGSFANGSQVANESSGPYSQNEASLKTNHESSLENTNNAKISNNFMVTADSGNNQASYNTGAGAIETGDAQSGLNLVNMINNNVTAAKFVLVFVNVLDTFLGDVVTPNQDATTNNWSDYYYDNYYQNYADSPAQAGQNNNDSQDLDDSSENTYLGDVEAESGFIDPSDDLSSLYNQADEQVVYRTEYIERGVINQFTDDYYDTYQNVYEPAVNKVFYKGQEISQQSKVLSYGASSYRRGLFLSERFIKATQSSFAAFLQGAKIKVTSSWLSILPFALITWYLRRRRKINLERYITNFLEIIL